MTIKPFYFSWLSFTLQIEGNPFPANEKKSSFFQPEGLIFKLRAVLSTALGDAISDLVISGSLLKRSIRPKLSGALTPAVNLAGAETTSSSLPLSGDFGRSLKSYGAPRRGQFLIFFPPFAEYGGVGYGVQSGHKVYSLP